MMTLATRCRDAAEQLSLLYGDFALFSLVQQEETAGKWDIVVSAPWVSENRAGIQRIVDVLRQYLKAEDWFNIARVLPLRVDSPLVQTMTRIFFAPNLSQKESGGGLQIQETSSFVTEAITVERAFVIIADRAASNAAQVGALAPIVRGAIREEVAV